MNQTHKTSYKKSYRKYCEALEFISKQSNISYRKNYGSSIRDPQFFLDRMRYFLKLIGNPEVGPKYIHVTGTAGKGSVSSMCHSALTSAGKKAGLFTSPYVTSAIEQIKVGDFYISMETFIKIVAYLKPFIMKAEKSEYGRPSSFELYLAIAFEYFKQQHLRICGT